jgi:iron complex transport system permease protein
MPERVRKTADGEAKIRMRIDEAERNLFRDDARRRYRMERRTRTVAVLCVAIPIVWLLCVLLPNGLDSNNNNLSLAWYMETAGRNAASLGGWISGGTTEGVHILFLQYIIAAAVGAALAISGSVYQGAFRNALASPTTLGVETGGVLGGMIYILLIRDNSVIEGMTVMEIADSQSFLQMYALAFSILIGCFLMVFIVSGCAKVLGRGRFSTIGLILSGVVFAGCIGEVLGLIQYALLQENTFDSRVYALRMMMMGTFGRALTPAHLAMIGIPVIVGITAVIIMRGRLNLLVFGEDEARTMGINVRLIRFVTVGIVTALTAVVISFCGMIGFIGFIVPHITRRLVGPDLRYLLPASALVGAIVMMIIYHVATVIGLASNINLMTSVVGGGIFLVMVMVMRRRSHADWA